MPRVATLFAAFLAACAGLGVWAVLDPSVPLLVDRGGARWILASEPFSPILRRPEHLRRFFRTTVRIPASSTPARVSMRAFTSATAALDGRVLARADAPDWKRESSFEIPSGLSEGEHALVVVVENDDAHPALLLACPALGVSTDVSSGGPWEASVDGIRWAPAVPADAPESLPIWEGAPSVADAFRKTLPWQALVFLVGVGAHMTLRSWSRGRALAAPSNLRWLLWSAWIALGVHNLTRIPLGQGFDVKEHVDYVWYVATNGRLPWADEGWQMFQPPLFYSVAALLSPLLSHFAAPLEQTLRVLPLLCGGLQIELAYRILRRSFPGDERTQSVGLVVAGLLPANVTMSQVVGNEPMFAALSAAVLLLCVRRLASPTAGSRLGLALLGLLVGLACLTKATGLLLVPIVALVLLARGAREHGASEPGAHDSGEPARRTRVRRSAAALLTTFGIALAVAGWYYARNWHHFGQPVVGGWDASIGIRWWQDPSYRVPEHLTSFGFSLHTPIFAAVRGFWDALYSSLWADGTCSGIIGYPPWNYAAMLTGVWLAVPLTIAIAAGMFAPLPRESLDARRLAVAGVLIFLLAMLYLFLELPIYTTVKASYTLGVGPCYGILAAAGARPLTSSALGRCIVAGYLTLFASFVVRAYWAS